MCCRCTFMCAINESDLGRNTVSTNAKNSNCFNCRRFQKSSPSPSSRVPSLFFLLHIDIFLERKLPNCTTDFQSYTMDCNYMAARFMGKHTRISLQGDRGKENFPRGGRGVVVIALKHSSNTSLFWRNFFDIFFPL